MTPQNKILPACSTTCDNNPRTMTRGVFLWSPPRCLSTAFECCIRQLPSVKVLHEPFASSYYLSADRKSTQFDDYPTTAGRGFGLVSKDIGDAICRGEYNAVFSKDIAYFIEDHLDILKQDGFKESKHTFLIRHPALAVPSLFKYRISEYQCVPNEAGFKQLFDVYLYVQKNLGDLNPVVVDASDLLMNPEGMLKAYCEAVGLTYKPGMSKWSQQFSHESFGCITCRGWHDTVFSSNGIIQSSTRKPIPSLDSLPQDMVKVIEEAMPVYEVLQKVSLKP